MYKKWWEEWESIGPIPSFVDEKFLRTGKGPCPRCGGTDRFYLTGPPNVDRVFLRCRQCNLVIFPDSRKKTRRLHVTTTENLRAEADERLAKARKTLNKMQRTVYLWKNDPEADELWLKRGILPSWRHQLVFGVAKREWKGGIYKSLTIPYWRRTRGELLLVHLQHRFVEWIEEGESPPPRYLPHFRGLSTALWIPPMITPPIRTSAAVLVEGAIKAAVLLRYVNLPVIATMANAISWRELEELKAIISNDTTLLYIPDPCKTSEQEKVVKRNISSLAPIEVVRLSFSGLTEDQKIDDLLNGGTS